MSSKFIYAFVFSFVVLFLSLITVLLFSHGNVLIWIYNIGLPLFGILLGLDFTLILYMGWDYINPSESRLPVFLGLGGVMLIALIYRGIELLLRLL